MLSGEDLGARVVWEGKHPITAEFDNPAAICRDHIMLIGLSSVIFVHGLGGHPVSSWSTKVQKQGGSSFFRRFLKLKSSGAIGSSSGNDPTFWPRDLLPEDVPHARIISYGYESEVIKMFAPSNKNNILWHGQNLLAEVQRVRSQNPERPAVFVCHSLGGILAKEALRLSRAARYQPHLQGLYDSTYGVIFLGTPHRGSIWAPWGALMGNLTKLALQSPNTALLKSLEVDSMALEMLASDFSNMIREDIAVYSFREERGMSGLYGLDGKIVDDFSSIIGDAAEGKEGIDSNHRDMCRFPSRHDAGYRKVSAEIARFVNSAALKSVNQPSGDVSNAISATEHWPEFIPITTRHKIMRDRSYNHISFGESTAGATIMLPYISSAVLKAISSYEMPAVLYLGSSAFELLDVLQLLPGQRNSNLLVTEQVPLTDIIADHRSYYSRITQVGLLELICQHFHSISETGDGVSVLTTIGTFIFSTTERSHTVVFDARKRSMTCIAPINQDFGSLQQSAAGKFRVRQNLNHSFFEEHSADAPVGPPRWIPMRPRIALWHSELDHPNCIRFMSANDLDEVNQTFAFAVVCQRQAFETLEQRVSYFDQYTQEGLGTLKIMSLKEISKAEHLPMVVTVTQWVLGGLARMPPENRSRSPLQPPDAAASQVPNPLTTTEAPRDAIGSEAPVHGGGGFIDIVLAAHPRAGQTAAQQTNNTVTPQIATTSSVEEIASRLLQAASPELDDLERLYRTSPSGDSMRDRISTLGETQPRLLACMVAVLILVKANAAIMARASASAPDCWLQWLTSTDVDMLIG